MKLIAIPAFSDNYIWLLHDGRKALVVDPGQAAPVLDLLRKHHLELHTILVTHHHFDHVGGVDEVREATGAQVVGPAHESIPQPALPLEHGDTVQSMGLDFRVIEVPGHTSGHIAYFARCEDEAPLLFCGDTLFSGGCGRLFEGTAAQMLASLDLLSALPGDTRVCSAHEYTLANLRFASAVDPDNLALQAYRSHCEELRASGLPTLPSTLARERDINPFLRSRSSAVKAQVLAHAPQTQPDDDVAVFAALRDWKNHF